MLAVLKYERRGLVDRHCTGIRGMIVIFLTDVKLLCLKRPSCYCFFGNLCHNKLPSCPHPAVSVAVSGIRPRPAIHHIICNPLCLSTTAHSSESVILTQQFLEPVRHSVLPPVPWLFFLLGLAWFFCIIMLFSYYVNRNSVFCLQKFYVTPQPNGRADSGCLPDAGRGSGSD